MKQSTVYNVLVKGYSIGLTFNHAESLAWKSQSMNAKDAVIVATPYRLERPV